MSSILLKRKNPMMIVETTGQKETDASLLDFTVVAISKVEPAKKSGSVESIYSNFLEQDQYPCTGQAFQLFFEESIKA
jgi:hypothetical protein